MEFNEIPAKQSENKWSEKMKSSYCQIEKQLLKSSKPQIAAIQLQKNYCSGKIWCVLQGLIFNPK